MLAVPAIEAAVTSSCNSTLMSTLPRLTAARQLLATQEWLQSGGIGSNRESGSAGMQGRKQSAGVDGKGRWEHWQAVVGMSSGVPEPARRVTVFAQVQPFGAGRSLTARPFLVAGQHAYVAAGVGKMAEERWRGQKWEVGAPAGSGRDG